MTPILLRPHGPLLALTAALALVIGYWATATDATPSSFELAASTASSSLIIQAETFEQARATVRAAGVEISHELPIIRAVAATLTLAERERLDQQPKLKIYDNPGIRVSSSAESATAKTNKGKKQKKTPINHHILGSNADQAHGNQILGDGVTIAVVDSGIWPQSQLIYDADGDYRLLAQYDALGNYWLHGPIASWYNTDGFGHGTHVASLAVGSGQDKDGVYNGAAPGADLVAVRIFDHEGVGTYADAIRGLSWVLEQADTYGIRVVNLSFSAPARSHYWQDPLNQAVMALWDAGLVVVTSAGNQGPEPLTVSVPGNVPYVITVGASTDIGNPKQTILFEKVASFSSAGPTTEGFLKPEIIAPGGHVYGLTSKWSYLGWIYRSDRQKRDYQKLSGTSQASALTAGAAALLLQEDPTLGPDDVKCRLLATARAALNQDGTPAYSVFTQGAGMIDVAAAVESTAVACANRGLDVRADVLGLAQFGGPANITEDGTFYLEGFDQSSAFEWNGTYLGPSAYQWSTGQIWADAYQWSTGQIWADAYQWSTGQIWADAVDSFDWPSPQPPQGANGQGILLPGEMPAGANPWVPHE